MCDELSDFNVGSDGEVKSVSFNCDLMVILLSIIDCTVVFCSIKS